MALQLTYPIPNLYSGVFTNDNPTSSLIASLTVSTAATYGFIFTVSRQVTLTQMGGGFTSTYQIPCGLWGPSGQLLGGLSNGSVASYQGTRLSLVPGVTYTYGSLYQPPPSWRTRHIEFWTSPPPTSFLAAGAQRIFNSAGKLQNSYYLQQPDALYPHFNSDFASLYPIQFLGGKMTVGTALTQPTSDYSYLVNNGITVTDSSYLTLDIPPDPVITKGPRSFSISIPRSVEAVTDPQASISSDESDYLSSTGNVSLDRTTTGDAKIDWFINTEFTEWDIEFCNSLDGVSFNEWKFLTTQARDVNTFVHSNIAPYDYPYYKYRYKIRSARDESNYSEETNIGKVSPLLPANDDGNLDPGSIEPGSITPGMLNVDQLSAITADVGVLTAGVLQGPIYQTSGFNPRIYISQLSGITATDAAGDVTVNIAPDGTASFAGNISGSSFIAGRLTLNSSGLVATDSTGATTFSLDAATGALVASGNIAASSFSAGRVTLNSSGLFATSSVTPNPYTFKIDATTGEVTIGSKIHISERGLYARDPTDTFDTFYINATSGTATFTGIANLDPAGSVVPGQVITQDSVTADKISVRIAGNNLISNATTSFEQDITGWETVGNPFIIAGSTLSLSTTISYYGANSLRVVTGTTVNQGAGVRNIPGVFRAGVTYIASGYVFADSTNVIQIAFGEQSGIDAVYQAITASPTPVRVSVKWVPSADKVYAAIAFYRTGTSVVSFNVDAVQIEEGDTLTSWKQNLSAATMEGSTITGGLIRTAAIGNRAELTSSGLAFYDSSSTLGLSLSTTGGLQTASSGPAALLDGNGLTVTDGTISKLILGTNGLRLWASNIVSRGSTSSLQVADTITWTSDPSNTSTPTIYGTLYSTATNRMVKLGTDPLGVLPDSLISIDAHTSSSSHKATLTVKASTTAGDSVSVNVGTLGATILDDTGHSDYLFRRGSNSTMFTTQISVPSTVAGAVSVASVAHGLTGTPTGALVQTVPGGNYGVTGFQAMGVDTWDGTNLSVAFRNSTGATLLASTVTISVIAWV